MSIPAWDASLPQILIMKSYAESPADVLLRTSMDFGPAKVRRRGTAGPRPVSGSIIVTAAQLATFKTFFNTTLLGGALRFRWRDPLVESMARLVASVTGADAHLCIVNGYAFVNYPSMDLSYDDFLMLIATDSAGKQATGYVHYDASADPFVSMTYASSGSNGITVADDDNIDFGTGNFTLVRRVALPDWTPASPIQLMFKRSGSPGNYVGYNFWIGTNGRPYITLYRNDSGTNFACTATPSTTDNMLCDIGAIITRESTSADGSVLFTFNGNQIGDIVAIPAATPISLSNSEPLYISGTSSSRIASINKSALLFNRALSAAEVLSLYQNGIANADKWGSQTPIYTSDFSAGVDSWAATRGTVTGNIDGIGGQDDTLRHWCNNVNETHGYYRSFTDYIGKYIRVSFKYYIPSGQTNVDGFKVLDSTQGSAPAGWITGATLDSWATVTADRLFTGNSIVIYPMKGEAYSFAGANSDADDRIYIKDFTVTVLGATLALESTGIGATDWQDSSSNDLDGEYPAAGCNVYTPDTGAQIVSELGGSTQNFASIESGFNDTDTSYDLATYTTEMRFTKTPSWKALSGDLFEIGLELEILP